MTRGVLIVSCLVWAIGCGGGSGGGSGSGSNIDSSTSSQSHPIDHQTAFLSDQNLCRGCHGADLLGGDAGVSCFSSSYAGASCHANGPNSHPDGWADPVKHGAAAKTAPDIKSGFTYCQKCHGQDLSGGFINVSCFTCHGVNAPHSPAPWRNGIRTHISTYGTNAQVCALCHTNGANSTLKPSPFAAGTEPGCFNNTLCHDQRGHEVNFSDPAVHGPQARADLIVCQPCHASPSGSGIGSNPRFNVDKGTLVNGCEDCHDQYTAHPVPWIDHNTSSNRANACGLCHGAGLGGGVGPSCLTSCHMENADSVHLIAWSGSAIYLSHGSYVRTTGTSKCESQYCHGTLLTGVAGSGPSCSTCHIWPYTPGLLTCTFCHDYPPMAGKHTKHLALTNVDCSACHNGAGDNTEYHYNGTAEVFFEPQYNSKSGPASFDATSKKCSYVSCHGGPRTQTTTYSSTPIQTPDWLNGSINVYTQCTSCHVYGASIPEYNSYYSGKHKNHAFLFPCTECHNVDALNVSHFTNLDTPEISGAETTIWEDINYNGYSCTVTCHGEDHDGRVW